MKAIVYSETGDPSVLQLVDREIPEPGPGEVRVRVVVSGRQPDRLEEPLRRHRAMPFPEVTPHHDGAGVIDAVGPDVDGHAVGDRVWTYMAAAGRPTGTARSTR